MKLIYLFFSLILSFMTYSAENLTAYTSLQNDATILAIGRGNFTDEIFDKLVYILDTADKKLLKEIAYELCSNIIASENTLTKQRSNANLDRFILLLVDREAVLNLSIKSWAIIIESYGSSNGKKLVIDNHPQGQLIKEQIFDDIASRYEESWAGYTVDEQQGIIQTTRKKLTGKIESKDDNKPTSIISFFKDKKTIASVTIACVAATAIWKFKSRKKDIQNPPQ